MAEDTTPAWIAAVAGVTGVFAGGFVSFWAQLWMLRRAERTRTRMAARVLSQGIQKLTAELGIAQLESEIRADSTRLLEDWEQHRDDLTRLPLTAWRAIVTLMTTLSLATQLLETPAGERASLPSTPKLAELLAGADQALEQVIADERGGRGLIRRRRPKRRRRRGRNRSPS